MTRRVLVVSHEASRTGAPKVAAHLLDALAAGGWETVLVHRWGGPYRAELDRHADRSRSEPAARLRVALRRNRTVRHRTARWTDALERRAVRAVLDATQPDLVWCNTVVTAPYAVEAARRGIPVVLHSHEQPGLVRTMTERTGVRPGATAAMHLVGCATETAAALADVLEVDPATVAVLPSPVDVADLRAAADAAADPYPAGHRPVVVACGTGDERKGVDVFGSAAALGAAAGAGADWVWVGDVPPAVRAPEVTYAGLQPSATPWLSRADVVVLASRADAFPLVVLEAMALGRPVVASDLPGTREQLGETGVFVPAGDPAALASAVGRLLSDPAAASELGRRAAERCAELWDVVPFGVTVRSIAEAATGGGPVEPSAPGA